MIYQSPPELGALWTEVNDMTKELGKEQKVLMAQELAKARRRRQRMQRYQFEIALGISVFICMIIMAGFFMWVAHDAQQRWGNPTEFRDTLAAVQKQEWFERQRRLQEYQEFLEDKRRRTEQNESSN
jgi:cytoskeletal protein RodZ